MLIRPIQSEKAYLAQTKRNYLFIVPADAGKQAVVRQIETQFGVTVTSVRIAIRKGKATKYSRGKHAYPGKTYRRDQKIAYVTLKEGDKIKVFEEEKTETEKPTKKASEKSPAKADQEGAKQ